MEQLFRDLERLWEIEALLADHEAACQNLEEDVEYEKGELNYAKIQLLSLDSPDFFLRLMPARLEKKKELAQAEVRTHTTALEKAKRELENKRISLAQLQEEYRALLPRREEYEAGKGSFPRNWNSTWSALRVSGLQIEFSSAWRKPEAICVEMPNVEMSNIVTPRRGVICGATENWNFCPKPPRMRRS